MIKDGEFSLMKKKFKIYAYGFEQIGFEKKVDSIKLNENSIIEFISFTSNEKLDRADGLIVPQGIFETFKSTMGRDGVYVDVSVYEDKLLDREREVSNLIKSEKWVCFLVGKIIDRVSQGLRERVVDNTDLCKRVLNAINVKRKAIDGNPYLKTKADEFKYFIESYGVARTIFNLPSNRDDYNVLVVSENNVYGFEYSQKIFILPTHIVNYDAEKVTTVVKQLTKSILDYIAKRRLETPDWLKEISFEKETILNEELNKLLVKKTDIEQGLKRFEEYKAILTTSGEILREVVIKILSEYFTLNIDPIDEGKEDLKILDNNNNILAFVEVKGTTKGIKREHINQVDSHRERAGVSNEISGVLLINSEMSIEGISNRCEATIAKEHIEHSENMNVLIIRSIDFLFLMLLFEKKDNRGKLLLEIVTNNKGWLRANAGGYDIIKYA